MIRLSQSQLTTWMRCHRQHYFQYTRGRQAPRKTGALTLGTGYHAALEAHYKGAPVDVDAQYAPIIAEAPAAGKLDVMGEKKQVKAMVEKYLDWAETMDIGRETLHVEHEMLVPLGTTPWGEEAVLHGIVDLIQREAGRVVLVDHKTAARLESPVPLDVSFQGKTYCLAWYLAHGEVPVFEYNLAKKLKHTGTGAKAAKPPFYARERVEYPVATLIAHQEHIMRLAEEIGRNAYPMPGDHCKWCPFQRACVAMDSDPAAAERMLDQDFVPRTSPSQAA